MAEASVSKTDHVRVRISPPVLINAPVPQMAEGTGLDPVYVSVRIRLGAPKTLTATHTAELRVGGSNPSLSTNGEVAQLIEQQCVNVSCFCRSPLNWNRSFDSHSKECEFDSRLRRQSMQTNYRTVVDLGRSQASAPFSSRRSTMIDKETFIKWSFERDVATGCYEEDGITQWDQLPKREQKIYEREAEIYFKLGQAHWPLDILERLKQKPGAVA